MCKHAERALREGERWFCYMSSVHLSCLSFLGKPVSVPAHADLGVVQVSLLLCLRSGGFLLAGD